MRAMFAVLTAIFVLAIGARADGPDHDIYYYPYTGAAQTFTVPAGVTSISVDAYGASGNLIKACEFYSKSADLGNLEVYESKAFKNCK